MHLYKALRINATPTNAVKLLSVSCADIVKVQKDAIQDLVNDSGGCKACNHVTKFWHCQQGTQQYKLRWVGLNTTACNINRGVKYSRHACCAICPRLPSAHSGPVQPKQSACERWGMGLQLTPLSVSMLLFTVCANNQGYV